MARKNGLSRRLAGLFLACGCAVALTGCSPVSMGFIAPQDGGYVLSIPERCGLKVVSIDVAYYTESADPSPHLWVATATSDTASNEVVLFQPNDGYATEGDANEIDFTKELTIGWEEGTDGASAGVTGVLADLGEDEVLWANGITSVNDYDQQTSGVGFQEFRCTQRRAG